MIGGTTVLPSAPTAEACIVSCDASAPYSNDRCGYNGTWVKQYRCSMNWLDGGPIMGNYAPDNDPACVAACQDARLARSGLPNNECRRNGVLLMANGVTDFQPPSAWSPTLVEDDTSDKQPDGSKPITLWDCNGSQRTATSTFATCVNGGPAVTAAQMSLLQQKARAYLAYVMGGADVPASLRGALWNDPSRNTGRRLAWLRQAFVQGKIKGRHFVNTSICGKSVALYRFSGTLSGIDLAACGAACGGVAPTHINPAEHVAIINRTIRYEAGACPSNDPIPTFFHASHYRVVGDTAFVIDPEPATLNASWGSTSASAAATGLSTGAALTAYRYGSGYPKKIEGTTNRTGWIGQPCFVGTTTVTSGTTLNQVWVPVPTNSAYLSCAACGASGQACCPNADFATSGLSTTCDANGGLGCNATTKKCN